MAEEIENGRISNFERLVTLTLDRFILHTVVHHSSTSTYRQISPKWKKVFVDGRTHACMDGHLRLALLGQLWRVDLKSAVSNTNESEALEFAITNCLKSSLLELRQLSHLNTTPCLVVRPVFLRGCRGRSQTLLDAWCQHQPWCLLGCFHSCQSTHKTHTLHSRLFYTSTSEVRQLPLCLNKLQSHMSSHTKYYSLGTRH